MNISELLQLYDSCFIHFFLLNRSLLLQRNQNEIEIMKTSNPVLQEIKRILCLTGFLFFGQVEQHFFLIH